MISSLWPRFSCGAMSFPGQLAAGTCEIVTLDRDSSQPRRTIARQTARCACKKGQIAGTTRARPACVDGKRRRRRRGRGVPDYLACFKRGPLQWKLLKHEYVFARGVSDFYIERCCGWSAFSVKYDASRWWITSSGPLGFGCFVSRGLKVDKPTMWSKVDHRDVFVMLLKPPTNQFTVESSFF